MPEYTKAGDALRGEKIAVSARSISQTRVVNASGRHKGQEATLRDGAYCVIEIPLRALANKK